MARWRCRYLKPRVPGGTGNTICEIGTQKIVLVDKPPVLRLPPGKQCVPMPNELTYCYMKETRGLVTNPRKVWRTFHK